MNAFYHRQQVYYEMYTDFSKLFDLVNYAVLVKVLADYDFGNSLHS